jgi:hypothetical protein
MNFDEGEILLDSLFGKKLYELCLHSDVNTVVEIGTSRGAGSTYCLIKSLKDSNKTNISFYTVETNIDLYVKALNNWKHILPEWASLLYGRIINTSDLDFDNLQGSEKEWIEQDIKNLNNSPLILKVLPEKIDLLFLDGGEFSTYSEFLILKDRARWIVIDDSGVRKGKKIKEFILNNLEKYEIIFDTGDRNGTFCAKTI